MTAPGPRESRIRLTASGPAIHLVEWGRPDGFPVVFLHGGAHDASRWSEVCQRLPDTLRPLVPLVRADLEFARRRCRPLTDDRDREPVST